MRIFCKLRDVLGASAVLAMLGGCSGANSAFRAVPLDRTAGAGTQSTARQVPRIGRIDNSLLPPNVPRLTSATIRAASFMDGTAALKPLIFVSDAANGVVKIYSQTGSNQKPVGLISKLDEPQGITTDAQGNLYIANTNSSNVLVYAPPYTKPPMLTLSDRGEFPADVAVSSTGVVAVTNICNAPNCSLSSGSVSFYAKGSRKPCATVADATFNFARVMFAAFDKNGALYIDGQNSGYQTSVGFIEAGCRARSITNITSSAYSITFGAGIQIDTAGRVVIADTAVNIVDTFDPSFLGGQLGTPTSTTPLSGSVYPLGIALLASGKSLYTADSAGSGLSNEYTYTAGGGAINSIAVGGQPIGVAVTPLVKL